jgi:hypothetical protein
MNSDSTSRLTPRVLSAVDAGSSDVRQHRRSTATWFLRVSVRSLFVRLDLSMGWPGVSRLAYGAGCSLSTVSVVTVHCGVSAEQPDYGPRRPLFPNAHSDSLNAENRLTRASV